MKAVICSLNSKYIHSSLAPWYLAEAAKAYCKTEVFCKVDEGTINQKEQDVLAMLENEQPDLLAFSCYIWNISYIRRLLPQIKELLPHTVILLGGPEVSFCPKELLHELSQVDYIICGEGERPFAMLLDCLNGADGKDLIPGLCYRRDDGTVISSVPYQTDEEPPCPYSKEYFDALNGRIAYLETSRGCPFSCSFCLSGRKDNVRFFSLDRAKKEILLLANSGSRTIKLVDRTFNCNPKRAYEIFSYLIEQYGKGIPHGIRFHFEVGADLFDDSLIELLNTAPAGLIQFEAGLQSFNNDTLEAVNRKTDMHRLISNITRLLKPNNLHLHIDLIAGLPYENLQRFKQSFNQAFALRPHMLQLGFLKLLHGSVIKGQAEGFDYIFDSRPPYEFVSSRWFSEQDKQELHLTEDALDRLYNSGRFLLTLDYILETTRISPYELMSGIGKFSAGKTAKISLEKYTALAFEYFSNLPGIDKKKLRDVMVCDRLRCENTGRIPPCLHMPEPQLKQVAIALRNSGKYSADGVPFAVARLYASQYKYAVADYSLQNPITGHFKLDFYSDL